jgi:hypothetical protein
MAGTKVSRAVHTFMGKQMIKSTANNTNMGEKALNQQFQASMRDLLAGFQEFINAMEGVTPDILVEVLEPTFGKALEYCPKDTGALVDSGYLEVEAFRGGARCEIGFGKGGKPPYTIYVHELPYNHAAPTRAKFLQAAIDEDYFSILSALPRALAEAAGTR